MYIDEINISKKFFDRSLENVLIIIRYCITESKSH